MTHSQIFKLIFKHDLRIENLSNGATEQVHPRKMEHSIMDFMKPDPTYSELHFTGTDLSANLFGLNVLDDFEGIISAINSSLIGKHFHTKTGKFDALADAVQNIEIDDLILISPKNLADGDRYSFELESDRSLKEYLEDNLIVVQKISALNGFDLKIYCKKNLYPAFFPNLRALVPGSFRFFSINGRKFNTERHFYFETWTLDRPPHGFEEVFPQSVI